MKNTDEINKIISNPQQVVTVGPSKSRKLLKYAFLLIPFLGGFGANQVYKNYQEQNKQEIAQQQEIKNSETMIHNVKQYLNGNISVFVAKDENGNFSVKQAVRTWSQAGAKPDTIELGLKALKQLSEFAEKSPESITANDRVSAKNAITSFGAITMYEPMLNQEIFYMPTTTEKAQLRDLVQHYKGDHSLRFNFEENQEVTKQTTGYKTLSERRAEKELVSTSSYDNKSTLKF